MPPVQQTPPTSVKMLRAQTHFGVTALSANEADLPKPGAFTPVFRSFAAFDRVELSFEKVRDSVLSLASESSEIDSSALVVYSAGTLFNLAIVIATNHGIDIPGHYSMVPLHPRFSRYVQGFHNVGQGTSQIAVSSPSVTVTRLLQTASLMIYHGNIESVNSLLLPVFDHPNGYTPTAVALSLRILGSSNYKDVQEIEDLLKRFEFKDFSDDSTSLGVDCNKTGQEMILELIRSYNLLLECPMSTDWHKPYHDKVYHLRFLEKLSTIASGTYSLTATRNQIPLSLEEDPPHVVLRLQTKWLPGYKEHSPAPGDHNPTLDLVTKGKRVSESGFESLFSSTKEDPPDFINKPVEYRFSWGDRHVAQATSWGLRFIGVLEEEN